MDVARVSAFITGDLNLTALARYGPGTLPGTSNERHDAGFCVERKMTYKTTTLAAALVASFLIQGCLSVIREKWYGDGPLDLDISTCQTYAKDKALPYSIWIGPITGTVVINEEFKTCMERKGWTKREGAGWPTPTPQARDEKQR